MCVGVPARVVEFAGGDAHLATVEVEGVRRSVNIELVAKEGLEVGSWVLIHVGFAMSLIDEEEAARTLDLLHQLAGLDNELGEFQGEFQRGTG